MVCKSESHAGGQADMETLDGRRTADGRYFTDKARLVINFTSFAGDRSTLNSGDPTDTDWVAWDGQEGIIWVIKSRIAITTVYPSLHVFYRSLLISTVSR